MTNPGALCAAPPALQVRGLSRSFGEVRAVNGLDLVVGQGESLGLLGPNGAGKTTTLRILSTLLAADEGDISVFGLDPGTTGGAEIRSRIGVVPQEIALYGELSAEENLRLFAELAGVASTRLGERVEWGLGAAGLGDRRRTRVSGFSGGMKRRLNLVAALLHEPDLVFLDEPTAGVDPQSRNHLFGEIERLCSDSKVTMIYTTHQMGEVERLCDRIVVMDRGRAIADGTLAELGALEAVARELEPRLRLGKPDEIERAASILREHGVAVEIEAGHADLETIFLSLTGRALRDGGDAAGEELS